MKKVTLGGAIITLAAAPFTVLAFAVDVPTAAKVFTGALVGLLSVTISWGGTDGLVEIVEDYRQTVLPKWAKRVIAFVLAFAPFTSISWFTPMREWVPGGGVVVFWVGMALGTTAPLLWPWVKNTVVARISREILSKPIVKRDEQGNLGFKAGPDEKTTWTRPDGAPVDVVGTDDPTDPGP